MNHPEQAWPTDLFEGVNLPPQEPLYVHVKPEGNLDKFELWQYEGKPDVMSEPSDKVLSVFHYAGEME